MPRGWFEELKSKKTPSEEPTPIYEEVSKEAEDDSKD